MFDCVSLAKEIKENVKKEISGLNYTPHLVCILVGNNPASESYVKGKGNDCTEVGIKFTLDRFEESISEEELLNVIKKYNNDISVHGILVQAPLPKHIDFDKVIDAISVYKDVDGFHPENIGNIFINKENIVSCTPKGVITLLEHNKINLKGMNAVVIGRSNIVGRPMAGLLINRDATVTVCHSRTKDLEFYTKNADLIIVAVGVKGILKADMIKKDAIIIDVGINKVDGKLYGDIDSSCYGKTCYYTPVPKGVGLLTRASLLENLLILANKLNKL